MFPESSRCGTSSRRGRWVACAVLVSCAAFSSATSGLVLAPGDPAPALRGRTFDGKRFHLDWDKHRLTLVNFWATYCEPCRVELPRFQELLERRGEDGFAVCGVLMEAHTDEVNEFVEQVGITYPNLEGVAAVTAPWGGIGVIPTSYLVRQDGTIARRYVGSTPPQLEGLVEDVERLLDGRPLGTMPTVPGDGSPPSEAGPGAP